MTKPAKTPSFGKLKRLDVSANTVAKCPVFALQMSADTHVVFHVRPATQANRSYFNGVLRRNSDVAKRASAGGALSTQTADALRDTDRELYPVHVISGWENVFDDDGEEVPFSVENVSALIEALPSWIFDEIRAFAAQPTNFAQIDPAEMEDKAKN